MIVHPRMDPLGARRVRSVVTDAQGDVRVEGVHRGSVSIEGDRGGELEVQAVAGTETEVTFELLAGVEIHGTVTDLSARRSRAPRSS